MKRRLAVILGLAAAAGSLAPPLKASNHREAPITALDQKADITDLYAFMAVSYTHLTLPTICSV